MAEWRVVSQGWGSEGQTARVEAELTLETRAGRSNGGEK